MQVHRITSAPRPHAEDQHRRIVQYTVSMAIRTVCLVLAFVVPGPLRWLFIPGAVVLPYVAVVLANAGREQTPPPPEAPGPGPVPAPPVVETGPVSLAQESSMVCSARACRADAVWALRWNNPNLHPAERRKTWLACDRHRERLESHLAVRGFLRETVPVTDLEPA